MMRTRRITGSREERSLLRWRAGVALAVAALSAPSLAAGAAAGPCAFTIRSAGSSSGVPLELAEENDSPAREIGDQETAGSFPLLAPEPSVKRVRTGGKKRFLAAAGEVVLL